MPVDGLTGVMCMQLLMRKAGRALLSITRTKVHYRRAQMHLQCSLSGACCQNVLCFKMLVAVGWREHRAGHDVAIAPLCVLQTLVLLLHD